MKQKRLDELNKLYDPEYRKVHDKIFKQSQKFDDRINKINNPIKEKDRRYPIPKGQPILVRHLEMECRICHTVLTTTNAYKYKVLNNRDYTCKNCAKVHVEEKSDDPLYKEKKEIKSILYQLYRRRSIKQFTWEYVEKRFSKPVEIKTVNIDKEVYDTIVRLFGLEYANKRFKPKSISLQLSFGDLTTKDGCRKLISLFQWELQKSRNIGRRKKRKYEAIRILEKEFGFYLSKNDINKNRTNNDYITYDKYYSDAYTGVTNV